MRLSIPFCIPFVHNPRTAARLTRPLLHLPCVDEVSVPVFRRPCIRAMQSDALDALEGIREAETEGTISLEELRARLGRSAPGRCSP